MEHFGSRIRNHHVQQRPFRRSHRRRVHHHVARQLGQAQRDGIRGTAPRRRLRRGGRFQGRRARGPDHLQKGQRAHQAGMHLGRRLGLRRPVHALGPGGAARKRILRRKGGELQGPQGFGFWRHLRQHWVFGQRQLGRKRVHARGHGAAKVVESRRVLGAVAGADDGGRRRRRRASGGLLGKDPHQRHQGEAARVRRDGRVRHGQGHVHLYQDGQDVVRGVLQVPQKGDAELGRKLAVREVQRNCRRVRPPVHDVGHVHRRKWAVLGLGVQRDGRRFAGRPSGAGVGGVQGRPRGGGWEIR
mmetsp:Transcript_17522/g.60175  ORF Transcript_17522/g.60175 Transcript_17522/m.60175 type:complete len:301 (+) Transcript_17522:636-1538(+)